MNPTPVLSIFLVAAATPIGSAAAQSDASLQTNPLLRGWLLEHLQNERSAARRLYRESADDASTNRSERAVCAARLIEHAADEGQDQECQRRVEQLRSLGVELDDPATTAGAAGNPPKELRAARDAVRAAQQVEDPTARQAALDAARHQLLEANRRLDPRRSSIVNLARREFETERAQEFTRRRAAQRRAYMGVRRDIMEILERAYLGRYDESERLAWFRFGMPKSSAADDSNDARSAANGVRILEAMIERLREGNAQRRTLEKVLEKARALIERRDHRQASRLLRVLSNNR